MSCNTTPTGLSGIYCLLSIKELPNTSIHGGCPGQLRVSFASQDCSDTDSDVSVDEDVEDGINETVEIGQGDHVPQQREVANHEDNGIGPPTDQKSCQVEYYTVNGTKWFSSQQPTQSYCAHHQSDPPIRD